MDDTVEDAAIGLGRRTARRSATRAASRASAMRRSRSTRPLSGRRRRRGPPFLVHKGEPAGQEHPHRWRLHGLDGAPRLRVVRVQRRAHPPRRVLAGRDRHHIVEAQFKVLRARPGRPGSRPAVDGIPRTKGSVTRPGRRRPRLRQGERALGGEGARAGEASVRSPRIVRRARERRARRAGRRRLQGGDGRLGCPGADHRSAPGGGCPVLGVCVGMQGSSTRGRARRRLRGPRRVARVVPTPADVLRTWAGTRSRPDEGSVLFDGIEDERSYFVHCSPRRNGPSTYPPFPKPWLTWAEHGGPPRGRRERPPDGDPVPPREVVDAGIRLLANWLGSLG